MTEAWNEEDALTEAEVACKRKIEEVVGARVYRSTNPGDPDCGVFDIGYMYTGDVAAFASPTYHWRAQLDLYGRDRTELQRKIMRLVVAFHGDREPEEDGWLWTGTNVVGFRIAPETKGVSEIVTTTVTKGTWLELYDWGLENGYTAEELRDMRCGDISLCVLTSGEIPLTDLPYLMTQEQFDILFPSTADNEGGGCVGVQGWSACQAFAQPVPMAFTGGYGGAFYAEQAKYSYTPLTLRRNDINQAFESKGNGYPIHVGDSGHPVYFSKGGKYVLTSHFTAQTYGSSYVKALPVIKAFAAACGSQLRLWDE